MQYYRNLHIHNLFEWFPYITSLAPYLYLTKLIGRIRQMLQTFSLAVWIHPCHHPLPLSSLPSLCTQYIHNDLMCTHKIIGFGQCTHRTSKIGNIGAYWNIGESASANRRCRCCQK